MNSEVRTRTTTFEREKALGHPEEPPGLYVHVPFCKTKCPYCDFYSITDTSRMSSWLESLAHEMELYRHTFGTFETLYVGGGTPTVLQSGDVDGLFEALHKYFKFTATAEITVEANPDDITAEKLFHLKSLGVNRLSVGIQSFDERELSFLQRRHTAGAAEKALGLVKSSGFENFAIDLMYGLPNQTLHLWKKTLAKAVTFEPTHLSCYQLTFEPTTPFGEMKKEGTLRVPTEKKEGDFFLVTSQFLEKHGFIHYEISNFAKDEPYLSRHNSKYWRHVDYLGLGPGAHSFQNGLRWWNHRSLERYCTDLQRGKRPIDGSEMLSPEQVRLERIYLGLRTRNGVALSDVVGQAPIEESVDRAHKSGFITIKDDRIIPTRKGFLVADRLPLMFPD